MSDSQQLSASFARKRLGDTIGVGAVLWAVGYAIGMILFSFVPVTIIGWIVLPLMTPVTVYASFVRLKTVTKPVSYVLLVASTWTFIAIAFDYIFLVYAFNVRNYYDFDVFIYYALTFLIPVLVGMRYRKL